MRVAAWILAVCAAAGVCAAQSAPIPAQTEAHNKIVLENPKVRVLVAAIPAGDVTALHRHERDYMTVYLTRAQVTGTVQGQPPKHEQFEEGHVRLNKAGTIHTTRNDASTVFRAAQVEFAEPQGDAEVSKQKPARYCNPGSTTACVVEKYLFCSKSVCVSDVTMGAGAITSRHSHTTDHMMVAITPYHLSDNVEGVGVRQRDEPSGGAEFLKAGITHQLTNTGSEPARFIVLVWR